MEKLLASEQLRAAYQAVKRNAGAPGIDGMTVEALGPHLREHWETVARTKPTGLIRGNTQSLRLSLPHHAGQ